MPREYTEVLKYAMELDLDERAVLAAELQSTLHEAMDPEIEEAWAVEVERRAAEVDAGKAEMVPWEDVLARLRARFVR